MSFLGALFLTWSAPFSEFTPSRANWRTRGFRRLGQASAGSSSCQTLTCSQGSGSLCWLSCSNDALDIGDLRAAESERIQGAGGSLIGSALCASHARREREEKRQANYANTAAPHRVTGLLVAGDLFADFGLAHLSLCIEGTALTLRLPLWTARWRRIRKGGSGKYFFASIPESAGDGLSRRLRFALAALQNGRTKSRCPKTELRSAMNTPKGVGMTAGAITMTNRTRGQRRRMDTDKTGLAGRAWGVLILLALAAGTAGEGSHSAAHGA